MNQPQVRRTGQVDIGKQSPERIALTVITSIPALLLLIGGIVAITKGGIGPVLGGVILILLATAIPILILGSWKRLSCDSSSGDACLLETKFIAFYPRPTSELARLNELQAVVVHRCGYDIPKWYYGMLIAGLFFGAIPGLVLWFIALRDNKISWVELAYRDGAHTKLYGSPDAKKASPLATKIAELTQLPFTSRQSREPFHLGLIFRV